jgi:hypothetical protein
MMPEMNVGIMEVGPVRPDVADICRPCNIGKAELRLPARLANKRAVALGTKEAVEGSLLFWIIVDCSRTI